jgi:hypothetical protein
MAGERAVKEALKEYMRLMSDVEKRFPLTDTELANAHNEAFNAAKELFAKETMIDLSKPIDADVASYWKDLNKNVCEAQRECVE